MQTHPIAHSVVQRPHWPGCALLAAVLATVLLSAGGARAQLLDGPVECEGLGIGACVPMEKDLFEVSGPFIVSEVGTGGDPLFTVLADEEDIILIFGEFATGRDLEQVGFRLTNVESVQDLVEGDITDVCLTEEQTNCISFLNWRNVPFTRPEVINVGGVQTIEWPLFTGGDPKLGSIVVIRPSDELVNGPVNCEGIGIGACTPTDKDLFDIAPPYTVFDDAVGGDPVFSVFAEEAEISLDFTEFATANTVEDLGFRLTGIESFEDLEVGEITDVCASPDQDYCVSFINWNQIPTSRPVIINDAGVQSIEWTRFTDGDPQLGSIVNIRPLPEPSTLAGLAAGLAALGLMRLAGRKRRL